MKTFRPVSNINFVSKLLAKILAKCICSRLESNKLFNHYQSAYRPMHSTETVLLKCQYDLLRNLGNGKKQFSAAFDTVDYSGVSHRSIGGLVYCISGNALRWFASYRQQMVKVKEFAGEPFQTKYGAPQGSVLGTLLFTLYTAPRS